MSCEETGELIDAYADGELDLVSTLNVERHMQVCEDCLRAHQNLQALRSLMRDESLYFRASSGLRKHVTSALRAEVKNERRLPLASWRWLAAAASVALVAIATLTFVQRPKGTSAEDLVAQEVISSHVRSLMEPHHSVDVPWSDQHTVKPWFNGKLDFSPRSRTPRIKGSLWLGAAWITWEAGRSQLWFISATSITSICSFGLRLTLVRCRKSR